jgi:hypothetical protein
MNTSSVIRVKVKTANAPQDSSGMGVLGAWRKFTRSLFAEPVVGNPLHEAWTANGEPLDRMSPDELAKSCASHYLVVPHSRSR